jgi:hypothetical protein
MARVKLTAGRIREFSLPEGRNQAFLWDTEARKLSVRITSKVKAFVFQSRLTDGKELRLTIGDSRDWSIEQAREEARRLQTTIDQGEDPRELRRQKEFAKVRSKAAAEAAKIEDEHRQCFTLQALCDAYVAALESKGKDKSARETRSVFKTHVLGAHPEIAKLPAREVTARQLAGIIRKVHEDGKQRTAGILRSYLSAAFNAAKKSPYDAKLPAELISFNIQSNPVDNIPAIPVGRGNRTLSEDELRAYMAGFGRDLADKALNLAL